MARPPVRVAEGSTAAGRAVSNRISVATPVLLDSSRADSSEARPVSEKPLCDKSKNLSCEHLAMAAESGATHVSSKSKFLSAKRSIVVLLFKATIADCEIRTLSSATLLSEYADTKRADTITSRLIDWTLIMVTLSSVGCPRTALKNDNIPSSVESSTTRFFIVKDVMDADLTRCAICANVMALFSKIADMMTLEGGKKRSGRETRYSNCEHLKPHMAMPC